MNSTNLEFILQYITYQLLYCKGHIQMTSNHSNVNVEIEKINKVNKITTLNLTNLEIILQKTTLTNYYIVKDTFK